MRINKHIIAIAVLIIWLVPVLATAQIVVSEIMYNAPGAEGSGEHDWVEIFNSGANAVDVSAYRFFEANTNHTLRIESGSATIPSGGYAVIASATSTFLADWSSFSGTLFDSSFNLNSTGELIGIRVDSSDTTHDFTYTPTDAATNNGSSLHRVSISGASFAANTPSPGSGSLAISSGGSSDTNSNVNPEMSTTTASSVDGLGQISSIANFTIEPEIFAYAGKDRELMAGADGIFEARALNKKKETVKPGRFLWTFGDGASAEGQTVMHHFAQPGRYAVVLDIADGLFVATHQIIVTVLPVSITISIKDVNIVLTNRSGKNLDLSYWSLRAGGKIFTLPKNTVLLAGAEVSFTNEVTRLNVGNDAELLYPNGIIAASAGIPTSAPADVLSSKTSQNASNAPSPSPRTETKEDVYAPPISSDNVTAPTFDSQTAVAALAGQVTPSGSYSWWLGAFGVAVIGSGAIVAIRHAKKREWDIIDDSDKK